MQIDHHIDALTRNGRVIVESLRGLPANEATRRPGEGQWSLLEIAAHLLDEEREDFRVRVDLTLHDPDQPWLPIDPPGWVTERRYAERNLEETVAAFAAERDRSLAWLQGVEAPDWNLAHEHPLFGPLRAGDILASWVGHDLLHLRQILQRKWAYLADTSRPFGLDYAGEW